MKRILVCLDGSQRAPLVLETAVALARQTEGKVRLFRSVGIPDQFPENVYSVSPDRVANILLENAKTELTELSRDLDPNLLDGICTRVSSPWDGICVAAQEYDADLIVLGSHGFSTLDRALGTTAARVVNHADRSVLVVRLKGVLSPT